MTALQRDFGVYVHVPFCAVRCGYCDFNTYTATDLGGGASQQAFASTALREMSLARAAMDSAGYPPRPASTVFFGGGTPTLLPASDLVRLLQGIRDTWGLADAAEVTTEANPDSVTAQDVAALAAAGFTRVSLGMQSAVPHVLATLDRTHNPARIPQVVQWARDAGLQVSLDLIYGTPGESLEDWRASLQAAIDTGVDHISAYALTVEPGTKMGALVRRGILPMPDDDDEAAKYELADSMLSQAGLGWYEISNWARSTPAGHNQCRHNLAYWKGQDWWGIGPGAHSYLAAPPGSGGLSLLAGLEMAQPVPVDTVGTRWWNVKHPRAYAQALDQGQLPVAGLEHLSQADAQLERVMLGIRLREGLAIESLTDQSLTGQSLAGQGRQGRQAVAGLISQGLVDGACAVSQGAVVLTLKGRLLADTVLHQLTST